MSIKNFPANMDLILRAVSRPVPQAETQSRGWAAPDTAFGIRAQECNPSTDPEPSTCPVCSVWTWPWPLKTSTSAQGVAALFELLPSGRWEFTFLCGDSWCEWELGWAAEGSALLTAVVSVLKLCRERKNCRDSVEAALAVLEESLLFLSSISGPFSQGRSAKMEILA